MAKPDDISSVLDARRRPPQRSFITQNCASRDMAEEIGYQLLLRPQWVRRHAAELIREGIGAVLSVPDLCLLMEGAEDGLVAERVEAARDGTNTNAITTVLATPRELPNCETS